MPGTVSKKMGIKEGTRAILVNAPEAARGAIDPPSLDVASELVGEFDYIHLFARTQAELDDAMLRIPNPADPDVPVGGEDARAALLIALAAAQSVRASARSAEMRW